MTTPTEFRDATRAIVNVTNSLIAEKALTGAEEQYLLASMTRLLAVYDSFRQRQPAPAAAPAAAPVPAPRPQLRLAA